MRKSLWSSRRLAWLTASIAAACVIAGAGAPLASSSDGGLHYIHVVARALNERNPGTENRVWWISYHNALPAHWLLQTPNCWGHAYCTAFPHGPPPGGEVILRHIVHMITQAHRSVDFSGLLPPPEGGFRQAIVEGLRQAIARGHRPIVRILIGSPPCGHNGGCMDVHAYLNAFERDLEGHLGHRLPLQVAAVSTYRQVVPTSWNHSKVIDVDGSSATVGGMNYYSADYLQSENPVNDVSMTFEGPAARDVVEFDNVLWRWTCENRHHPLYVSFAEHGIRGGCILHESVGPPPRAGDVAILTLGRLGNGIPVPGQPEGKESPPIPPALVQGSACHALQRQYSDTNVSREYEYRNPGETGLRALIASAQHSIFISQQDMLSCVYSVEALFDERVFAALGAKIAEGIPIKIVLSNEDAKIGNESYSNKGYFLPHPVMQTAQTLAKVVEAQQGITYDKARAMVCADVGLSTIRNSDRPRWPNGSAYANHAKVVSVDDAAFYIGSENLYPARLQELGLIVENQAASATLKRSYLDPLWKESRGLAYIDPDRTCGPF